MTETVIRRFCLPPIVSSERYGHGHINQTFLLVADTGERFILQKISSRAFKDVPALMGNLVAVTHHLQKKGMTPTLTALPTKDGGFYFKDAEGDYWRLYEFIENSVCLQKAECKEDFYQSARACGAFAQALNDFPADTLAETIPNFHNTPDRFRLFHEALDADVMGRASLVKEEIDFALAHEAEASILVDMLAKGELPLRVTHNDTKLNNVMLDATTREPLCVIDLDTVMPGLIAYDFGDSIRFGASTAAEDETDLSKVKFDMEYYKAYLKGYYETFPDMTDAERKSLPIGSKMMTLECGVRFLTDYLAGDVYFGIHRPDHNLDRCRTQFALVADMERQWDAMCSLI